MPSASGAQARSDLRLMGAARKFASDQRAVKRSGRAGPVVGADHDEAWRFSGHRSDAIIRKEGAMGPASGEDDYEGQQQITGACECSFL